MNSNIISTEVNKQRQVLRRIRSFVHRHGRMTNKQQYALDKLWLAMGINYQDKLLDINTLFDRVAPVTIEIGFGMGASLVTIAAAHHEQNFIGIEVYLPGIGACLDSAHKAGLSNLRIICHDAVEVLERMIPELSLARVQLFFPDPWHKARHNKRRIIQTSFVKLVWRKLVASGIFHIATDWQPYAEHILTVVSAVGNFRNLSSVGDYVIRPSSRPLTKFEQRAYRLGYSVWDLMFEKVI